MRIISALALISLLCGALSFASEKSQDKSDKPKSQSSLWMTDLDLALAKAAREKKPLLSVFS